MARLESGYLLDKLAVPCVVDTEATFSAVKRLMDDYGVDLSERNDWGDLIFDMDEIKRCCDQNTERDAHDLLREQFRNTSMENCDDYELWCCIEKTFTTNAKKIVQVFMDYIQPKCKEISNSENM